MDTHISFETSLRSQIDADNDSGLEAVRSHLLDNSDKRDKLSSEDNLKADSLNVLHDDIPKLENLTMDHNDVVDAIKKDQIDTALSYNDTNIIKDTIQNDHEKINTEMIKGMDQMKLDTDLNLDLPTNLNDDFTKLYDFDAKNPVDDDDDIFSAHDLLKATFNDKDRNIDKNFTTTTNNNYNNTDKSIHHVVEREQSISDNIQHSLPLDINNIAKDNVNHKTTVIGPSKTSNDSVDSSSSSSSEESSSDSDSGSDDSSDDSSDEETSKIHNDKDDTVIHLKDEKQLNQPIPTKINSPAGNDNTHANNKTDSSVQNTIQAKRQNSIIPGQFHPASNEKLINDIENMKFDDIHLKQSIPKNNLFNSNTNSKSNSNNNNNDNNTNSNNNNPNNINLSTNSNDEIQSLTEIPEEQPTIFAYARLDFQSFTFYVQTLHAVIGRRSENDTTHKVDVNLGPSKSISRRHAQIFYNFGTGRFELSIIGKNGAFVDDVFVERGNTVPLKNKTKIQIGQIPFQFVLPEKEPSTTKDDNNNNNSNNDIITPSKTNEKLSKPTNKNDTKIERKISDIDIKNNINMRPKNIDTSGPPIPTISKKKAMKLAADNNIPSNTPITNTSPIPPTVPATKKGKTKKTPKPPKKVYTIDEIPVEYRTKPAFSYSTILTACIRKYSSENGMSLSEIYGGIRELYPFYKYCPDGWQSSVRHNLSLNKSFRKVSKQGKGWLWGLDEAYIAEREKLKKKQAEAAAAKAHAAQLRLEQQNQNKNKRLAEINSRKNMKLNNGEKRPNISQTLAANRSGTTVNNNNNTNNRNKLNDHQRTMKYLQEQLITLTRDRKGLPKQTIATILTQALAMTINQVTQAANNKGITGNPLTALMDKNPQHLSLILAAAVNASTAKVTNGAVKQLVSPTVLQAAHNLKNKPTSQNHDTTTTNNNNNTTNGPTIIKQESTNVNNMIRKNGTSTFDPSSLSKFFQPKNQSSAPNTNGTNNTNSNNTTKPPSNTVITQSNNNGNITSVNTNTNDNINNNNNNITTINGMNVIPIVQPLPDITSTNNITDRIRASDNNNDGDKIIPHKRTHSVSSSDGDTSSNEHESSDSDGSSGSDDESSDNE